MSMTESPSTHSGPPANTESDRLPVWMRTVLREIACTHHPVLYGQGANDLAPWEGRYLEFAPVLAKLLARVGYGAVAFYDLVDGLAFPDTASRDLFERVAGSGATGDGGAAQVDGSAAPGPNGQGGTTEVPERVRQARQQDDALERSLRSGRTSLREPRDALAAARRAMSQSEVAVAVVMRYADVVLQDPSAPDRIDREVALWVKKAGHDARLVGGAGAPQLRNLLVLVADDLDQVPAWLYRDDPLFAPVQISLPDRQDREAFLTRYLEHFYGAAALAEVDRSGAIRLLTDLTDGMGFWDLDALRRTSVAQAIPASAGRRLALMYRYGEQDDPYEQLSLARIRSARATLRERVIGQDHAVDALVRAMARAHLGIGRDPDAPVTLPRGVFFFVGPTGVGKTELARALAVELFGDASSLLVLDMSNFSEEHAQARLVGAPPGFVGYEAGGELTNGVRAHPHCIVLLDEIEKAHPVVFDKLLQVLDEGRLVDGMGRTVHFGEAIIIFTSNLGSRELYGRIRSLDDLPSYPEVAALYRAAVEQHFVETLNRPELLGRFGKAIVPFDVLREPSMDAITRKAVDQALAGVRREREIEVDWPAVFEAIRLRMREPSNLKLGGRAIVSLVREHIEGGLADWWLEHEPAPVAALRIGATSEGVFTFGLA